MKLFFSLFNFGNFTSSLMNPLVYVNVTFKNIELKPLFSEECMISIQCVESVDSILLLA